MLRTRLTSSMGYPLNSPVLPPACTLELFFILFRGDRWFTAFTALVLPLLFPLSSLFRLHDDGGELDYCHPVLFRPATFVLSPLPSSLYPRSMPGTRTACIPLCQDLFRGVQWGQSLLGRLDVWTLLLEASVSRQHLRQKIAGHAGRASCSSICPRPGSASSSKPSSSRSPN